MNCSDSLKQNFDPRMVDPISAIIWQSEQHKTLLYEYCTLSLQETLTDAEQDRIAEILTEAETDPLLSFWLDEADHLVAHRLNLVSEAYVEDQQSKLRRDLGQTWANTLWNDLQHCTKALQVYLQRLGLYRGAIDGICGPSTQEAVQSYRKIHPNELPKFGLNTGL